MSLVERILVQDSQNIKEVMRVIDRSGLGIAFVVDEAGKLIGVATDGDIRRGILRGATLGTRIQNVMNKDPIVLHEGDDCSPSRLLSNPVIKKKMPAHGVIRVPLVDKEGKVADIIFISKNRVTEASRMEHVEKESKVVKHVLIIGGAGYVGSVLCRRLLSAGYIVRCFDTLLYGDHGIRDLYEKRNFEFIRGDVLSIGQVAAAMKSVDAVVHLAAIVGDPACRIEPEVAIRTNYLAAMTVAEACKYYQINRLVFASTCSVYGQATGTVVTEESPTDPISVYAETKLESENGILSLVDDNFSPCVLRFATIYGLSPRMRFDLVVNLFAGQGAQDGKILIHGGEQWRPFLHVSDAARAIVVCLESELDSIRGQIFNTGSDNENYQIRQLGGIVKKVIPSVDIESSEKQMDERTYKVSFRKIRDTLGFLTQMNVEKGVREIVEAMRLGVIGSYSDAIYDNHKLVREIVAKEYEENVPVE